MLTLVTREYRNGVPESFGIVLNTEFITELRAYKTTKSRFKFFLKPEDRRGGEDMYIVSESMATLQTEMDKYFTTISIDLDVYPDNDATKDTVVTTFQVKEIVRAYPNTRGDWTKCWIEVNEKGWNIRKYLVAHYYVNIPALAETGTTTSTSSTTTSTTSTSSTTTTTTSTTTTKVK